MNSNQRSQINNQTSNGGNEKSVSTSRAGTVEKDNMNPAGFPPQAEQSGTLHGSRQGGQAQDSTERTGSQTGNEQQGIPAQRQPGDRASGHPVSPTGKHLAADQKMDDDTGLSNTANRQSALDDGSRQDQQSNVGRRSDGTPD